MVVVDFWQTIGIGYLLGLFTIPVVVIIGSALGK